MTLRQANYNSHSSFSPARFLMGSCCTLSQSGHKKNRRCTAAYFGACTLSLFHNGTGTAS
jgi:hypothetical protein